MSLWLVAACGAGNEAAAPKLLPVTLPDLSRASETVRQQVQERYGAVQQAHDAASHGELGKVLISAHYFNAAEPALLNAQTLAPDDFRWPYYLGHVYRQQNDWGRAAAAFERALAIRANDVSALIWLGETRLDLGQPEAAQRAFDEATTLEPRASAAWFGAGRAALAQQSHARAVEHFERALRLDPQASAVHYPLAMAYRALGDAAKAEAQLRQRGDLQPGMPDPLMREVEQLLESAAAYDTRAYHALNRGDWPAAIAAARAGIPLAKDNPSLEGSLRHRLGTALAQTGDTSGAFAEFQRAVAVSPGFPRARYSLGVMLSAAGRAPEAIEQLSTAVKLDPGYVEARVVLGEVLLAIGRTREALAQYDSALALAPDFPPAVEGHAAAVRRARNTR
jgi:tetratricopeptide (TPR) repeat protein